MISAASALDERERQRRGALPNISVNALVIDNQLSDTVYVATDIGVFSDARRRRELGALQTGYATNISLIVHQDGAESPTNLPNLGKVVSPNGGCGDRNERGFLVNARRKFLIGSAAALLSAPAIIRAGSLMKVRGGRDTVADA
jgi:hypothetical protein